VKESGNKIMSLDRGQNHPTISDCCVLSLTQISGKFIHNFQSNISDREINAVKSSMSLVEILTHSLPAAHICC